MNCWQRFSFPFCLFLTLFIGIDAWDNDEMELFDLVEEINANFYEVLGVDQGAPVADIKRAYRRLSVKLHPDKNKEEGAEEKFRQIVAIYEVLKDEERRKQYDHVLEYGLPDWRQPVYYYRKVRKLGFFELCALLLVILTVGHFLVVWSIYLERRFEMQEIFDSRKKKEKKGKKKLVQERKENEKLEAFQEELDSIPRPRLADILPLQMIRGLIWMVLSVPSWLLLLKDSMTKKEEPEEDDDADNEEIEGIKQRKRQRVEVPDSDFKPELAEVAAPVCYTEQNQIVDEQKREAEKVIDRSGKEWTDDEISLLAKAVARYPAGVSARWEKIAEHVGRTVTEVTKMSKQLKASYALSIDPSAQGITGQRVENLPMKKGAKPDNSIISERLDFGNPSLDDVKTAKKKSKAPNAAAVRPESEQGSKLQAPNCDSDKNNAKEKGDQKLVVDNTTLENDSLVWSQNQQKILEWALAHYPKGTAERWDKIAEHIPGKSKEDCVARFKYLAEIVRKRKAASNAEKPKS